MGRVRRARSFKRGPKNQLWTATVIDQFELTTGLTSPIFQAVIPSDWERAGVSLERATVLRIRGWVSLRQQLTAGVASRGTVFMYMGKFDEDETPPNGGISTTYADEDILWTGGVLFPEVQRVITVEGGSSIAEAPFQLNIDVKAMRRVTSGQAIDLVFTNNMTGSVEVSGVLRALVKMGGN